ncbi:hypothetical protein E2562_028690 [Oryza meyeriana var. granulata]|uniref:Uncharacterized protein n=1 Tax=Oryza meyeriana var. granulata TaxID=110450 RepID=A0A6G1CI75_9ORYZ|nr:hypothetical protein E2562_028690 [Oryza meyeriana var. granulata]
MTSVDQLAIGRAYVRVELRKSSRNLRDRIAPLRDNLRRPRPQSRDTDAKPTKNLDDAPRSCVRNRIPHRYR